MITHVVIDIEGTTSSTGFVHQTLYPYSRARFGGWIERHHGRAEVAAQVDSVRVLAGEPGADLDRVVWWLNHWLDGDEKVTPLKAFQGWIWAEGFAAGDLTSHFFDDAIPAMRRWKAAGLDLSIFSSGSVSAQLAWFGNTPEGDILPLFSHHFDTENTGPKREADSYRKIAATLGAEPGDVLFLSDLGAELDAAAEAGWRTIGVRREGDQYVVDPVGDHPVVHTFDSVDPSDEQLVVDRR
ncbi:MAG: acireductone synthase [Ilumatobacteraceae bacterium]